MDRTENDLSIAGSLALDVSAFTLPDSLNRRRQPNRKFSFYSLTTHGRGRLFSPCALWKRLVCPFTLAVMAISLVISTGRARAALMLTLRVVCRDEGAGFPRAQQVHTREREREKSKTDVDTKSALMHGLEFGSIKCCKSLWCMLKEESKTRVNYILSHVVRSIFKFKKNILKYL